MIKKKETPKVKAAKVIEQTFDTLGADKVIITKIRKVTVNGEATNEVFLNNGTVVMLSDKELEEQKNEK